MSRLRSYARLPRESQKVKDGAEAFKAVYAEVDARSEGRCEVTLQEDKTTMRVKPGAERHLTHRFTLHPRCPRRAVEHHHLFLPRLSHHTANEVVHICRACHDRATYPYNRGRLCFLGRVGEAFMFTLRWAASKFQARGQGE